MSDFNMSQEPCKYRIELSGRFPERGMPQPAQAMAAAFPQICVCDGVEVVEIHQPIRTAVDHCERNRAVFHDQTLIHSFSGTRRLEEPLTKTAVCTPDSFAKKRL
jgi:hypothetical protein